MEAVTLEEVTNLSSGDFNRLLEENPGHLFLLILMLILVDDCDTISYMLISVLTDSNKGGVVRDPG